MDERPERCPERLCDLKLVDFEVAIAWEEVATSAGEGVRRMAAVDVEVVCQGVERQLVGEGVR
jgi:hypothetical protein